MAVFFLDSMKTSSTLNLWQKITLKEMKKKKKRIEFGIRKINCEFHKQQGQSSQVLCTLVAVASLTGTAAAPFTHPGPLCACGFLGPLPTLACQLSFPDRVCSSWGLPAPRYMDAALHCSLLSPGSSVILARCHYSWDSSAFQMCLKLASVFKSN